MPNARFSFTTRSGRSQNIIEVRWRGEASDPAGAAAAFEDVLADRLRVLGPDHPDTLATRNNLAYWRGAAGLE